MVGGLYVHFPWCVRKCPYCDFNSHPLRGDLDERTYLNALLANLEQELERAGGDFAIDTVYFGGGTPSLFGPETFRTLLAHGAQGAVREITLEANPGTLEHRDFAAYRGAGISRISLGAQSFDADQLRVLGRIHSAEETRHAARRIAQAGFDGFNIDLMYGLPGQTADAALGDLEQAIRLEPQHISWYQLTIEPRTEFARRPPANLPGEQRLLDIEARGIERLAQSGFERYEVSAYARPGHQCLHNINYWRFGDYLGIGAGAHGKIRTAQGILRTAQPSQPRRFLATEPTTVTAIADEDLPVEFMMNALRLIEGVDTDEFERRTGAPYACIEATHRELHAWGLMRDDRLALTETGRGRLDSVVARFLA